MTEKIVYFLRSLFWKTGYDFHKIDNMNFLYSLIYRNYDKNFVFLQIGANDGVRFDPINFIIKKLGLTGFCVEPIPEYFAELERNYAGNDKVKCINFAIHSQTGKINMYRHVRTSDSKSWTNGIASVNPEHYKLNNLESNVIEKVEVDAITFEDLFSKMRIQKIDLLVMDTEGYDYELLKMYPFESHKPKIIQFEHGLPNNFMTFEKYGELIAMLTSLGYNSISGYFDTIAYLEK